MTGYTGEKLIRMANQIASFFRSYPDDEAMAGIAKHLESFGRRRCDAPSRRRSRQARRESIRWW